MKLSGNTILVTGGGSGIGEALAHRFHDLGNTVIVAGRRQDVLDQAIAGRGNMHALTLDIDNAESIAAFAERIVEDHPGLNMVFNNAGIMRIEVLDQARDLTDAEAMIRTNLLGPIRLIDSLIDHLGQQDDAAIVNVSSGLAFVPFIATPTYNATKAAMHSYTVSLREVLRDRVRIIELVPPAVQTELTPGQSQNPAFVPLKDFIDQVMALFSQHPTPTEIVVEAARASRNAEADHRFDEVFAMWSDIARSV